MTEEQEFIFDLKGGLRSNPDLTHGSRNKDTIRITDSRRTG